MAQKTEETDSFDPIRFDEQFGKECTYMTAGKNSRLLVVSNRLPISVSNIDNEWQIESAPGGLVTALSPIMQRAHGMWVGWPGCSPGAPVEQLLQTLPEQMYSLKPIPLSDEEISKYYRGFSNRSIWPLFHDLLGHFSFSSDEWEMYQAVNRRFAEAIVPEITDDTFVWIHDYQLLLVGRYLREMGVKAHLSYFLHIPFPNADLYRRLPVRAEIIEGMIAYDHLGFQTLQDRRNFISCARVQYPSIERRNFRRYSIIEHGDRNIRVGNYPISIDFDEFNNGAHQQGAQDSAWFLHENFRNRVLVLGLDRLDYTKGIKERFLAFERALEKYPDMQGKVSMIQVVIPSRQDVPDYADLKGELDALAGRINGRFTRDFWIPIHYQFRNLQREQLLGHYKACEIAMITPLRDGMNLVAKEYCASSVDDLGVLILSEFAGAARELHEGAILVNPYDVEATADALYQAFTMEHEERISRMRNLRAVVQRNSVGRWVNSFLDSAALMQEAAAAESVGAAE